MVTTLLWLYLLTLIQYRWNTFNFEVTRMYAGKQANTCLAHYKWVSMFCMKNTPPKFQKANIRFWLKYLKRGKSYKKCCMRSTYQMLPSGRISTAWFELGAREARKALKQAQESPHHILLYTGHDCQTPVYRQLTRAIFKAQNIEKSNNFKLDPS